MARISYKRHRFPATVIQHAVWLYFRFALSLRDAYAAVTGLFVWRAASRTATKPTADVAAPASATAG